MDVNIVKSLSSFEWFRNSHALKYTSEETLNRLWKAGTVKSFSKGEVILRAKEKITNIAFLLSGKVIVYNLTHSGRRKILFVLGPGNLLNDHVFDSQSLTVYCETLEPCLTLLIPKDVFTKCMEDDYSLVRGIMEEQERKMWRLSHQLKNTVGNINLERKLAAKLWKLARDFGIPGDEGIEIDVVMSKTFLADMLGVPRETASRMCRRLVQYGLIFQKGKRIIVRDPDILAHYYKTGE